MSDFIDYPKARQLILLPSLHGRTERFVPGAKGPPGTLGA